MNNTFGIIGYGSLILPTSALARFDTDLREHVDSEMTDASDERRLKTVLSALTSEKAITMYENAKIEATPIRINGFKRYYALETEHGNQLIATPEHGWINGTLISPLTKKEVTAIAETEPGYQTKRVQKQNIGFYTSQGIKNTVSLPDTVYIHVKQRDNNNATWQTTQKPDPVYHNFIRSGISIIHNTSSITAKTKATFMDDFKTTTLVRHTTSWESLASSLKAIR